MLRFLRLLRLAFWRAFQHDAFSIAKASAYSSILTFFPMLLVVGSVLATSRKGAPYLREVSYALSRILPAGSNTATQHPSMRLIYICAPSISFAPNAFGILALHVPEDHR